MNSVIESNRGAIHAAARILVGALFLLAAMGKIENPGMVAQGMTAHGLPLADILVYIVIIFEIAGGLALVLGWHTRLWSFLLFGFLVLATLIYHPPWSPAELRDFSKNIAILGALLLLLLYGAGAFSLDKD